MSLSWSLWLLWTVSEYQWERSSVNFIDPMLYILPSHLLLTVNIMPAAPPYRYQYAIGLGWVISSTSSSDSQCQFIDSFLSSPREPAWRRTGHEAPGGSSSLWSEPRGTQGNPIHAIQVETEYFGAGSWHGEEWFDVLPVDADISPEVQPLDLWETWLQLSKSPCDSRNDRIRTRISSERASIPWVSSDIIHVWFLLRASYNTILQSDLW